LKKSILISLLTIGFVYAFAASADPTTIKSKIKYKPSVKTLGTVYQANLTPKYLGFDGEFCNRGPCRYNLRALGVNKATCPIRVRIFNNGNKKVFKVRIKLTYTWGQGHNAYINKSVHNINPGKSVMVKFHNISLYNLNKPFKLVVDFDNKVTEKNESDNVISWTPTQ